MGKVSQIKKRTTAEAVANTGTGLVISMLTTQVLALLSPFVPGIELVISIETNMLLTGILTVISVGRNYVVRNFFHFYWRGVDKKEAKDDV